MIVPMQIVTNCVLLCFSITTKMDVPCACPDGWDGCCVAHYKTVEQKKLVPCDHILQRTDFIVTEEDIRKAEKIVEELKRLRVEQEKRKAAEAVLLDVEGNERRVRECLGKSGR